MFLVSITYRGLRHHWEFDHSSFHVGTMVVDLVVDGVRAIAGPDMRGRLVVVEGNPLTGVELARSATVVIDHGQRMVQVHQAYAGTTPVYYHQSTSGEFYCATSISLLQRAGVRLEMDEARLPEFFVYRTVSPPRTLVRGVFKCAFGEQITLRILKDEARITRRECFDYPVSGTAGHYTEDEAAEIVLAKLKHSMRQFLPDASAVAIPLSGGLDSSTLFRLGQHELGISRSYSAGFPFEAEGMNREREYAVSAAEALGSEHYYHETTLREYLFGFLRLLNDAEEPLHHMQSVLLGLLFRKGLEGERYILSGLGGDVLFGTEFQTDCLRSTGVLYESLAHAWGISALRKLTEFTGYGRSALRIAALGRSLNKGVPLADPSHILWSDEAYGDRAWVSSYFHVTESDIIAGRLETLMPYADRPLFDLLAISGHMNDGTTPHVWGKAAEGAGCKLFAPLCEPSLVRFVSGLPWKDKLRKPKNILRRVALKLRVPRFVVERPKSGFGLNRTDWALPGSFFEPLVPLAAHEFDLETIRSLQDKRPERAELFWTMLNYTLWKRLVINGEPLGNLEQELEEQILALPSVTSR